MLFILKNSTKSDKITNYFLIIVLFNIVNIQPHFNQNISDLSTKITILHLILDTIKNQLKSMLK